jgi:predicted transcriptional regulator of viral defense system
MTNRSEQVLDILRQQSVLRPRDLRPYGISPMYLSALCDEGRITRLARGLYRLPDADITEHHTLAQACKRVPQGVVCLLSALLFHSLTTESPFKVWMAIEMKSRLPRITYPALRFFRFSGAALNAGIETHLIEGVPVRVYSPAKTVVDCFKYRNKIGLDVAIAALRDCRRQHMCTNDDLWQYAKLCRVSNVMWPYLEATM